MFKLATLEERGVGLIRYPAVCSNHGAGVGVAETGVGFPVVADLGRPAIPVIATTPNIVCAKPSASQ